MAEDLRRAKRMELNPRVSDQAKRWSSRGGPAALQRVATGMGFIGIAPTLDSRVQSGVLNPRWRIVTQECFPDLCPTLGVEKRVRKAHQTFTRLALVGAASDGKRSKAAGLIWMD